MAPRSSSVSLKATRASTCRSRHQIPSARHTAGRPLNNYLLGELGQRPDAESSGLAPKTAGPPGVRVAATWQQPPRPRLRGAPSRRRAVRVSCTLWPPAVSHRSDELRASRAHSASPVPCAGTSKAGSLPLEGWRSFWECRPDGPSRRWVTRTQNQCVRTHGGRSGRAGRSGRPLGGRFARTSRPRAVENTPCREEGFLWRSEE